ncbi:hypothetical protein D3C83_112360 [compost metagenome]
MALRTADREQLQASALHVRVDRHEGGDLHLRVARDQIGCGRPAALEWHVHQLHPGHETEELGVHVRKAADAR